MVYIPTKNHIAFGILALVLGGAQVENSLAIKKGEIAKGKNASDQNQKQAAANADSKAGTVAGTVFNSSERLKRKTPRRGVNSTVASKAPGGDTKLLTQKLSPLTRTSIPGSVLESLSDSKLEVGPGVVSTGMGLLSNPKFWSVLAVPAVYYGASSFLASLQSDNEKKLKDDLEKMRKKNEALEEIRISSEKEAEELRRKNEELEQNQDGIGKLFKEMGASAYNEGVVLVKKAGEYVGEAVPVIQNSTIVLNDDFWNYYDDRARFLRDFEKNVSEDATKYLNQCVNFTEFQEYWKELNTTKIKEDLFDKQKEINSTKLAEFWFNSTQNNPNKTKIEGDSDNGLLFNGNKIINDGANSYENTIGILGDSASIVGGTLGAALGAALGGRLMKTKRHGAILGAVTGAFVGDVLKNYNVGLKSNKWLEINSTKWRKIKSAEWSPTENKYILEFSEIKIPEGSAHPYGLTVTFGALGALYGGKKWFYEGGGLGAGLGCILDQYKYSWLDIPNTDLPTYRIANLPKMAWNHKKISGALLLGRAGYHIAGKKGAVLGALIGTGVGGLGDTLWENASLENSWTVTSLYPSVTNVLTYCPTFTAMGVGAMVGEAVMLNQVNVDCNRLKDRLVDELKNSDRVSGFINNNLYPHAMRSFLQAAQKLRQSKIDGVGKDFLVHEPVLKFLDAYKNLGNVQEDWCRVLTSNVADISELASINKHVEELISIAEYGQNLVSKGVPNTSMGRWVGGALAGLATGVGYDQWHSLMNFHPVVGTIAAGLGLKALSCLPGGVKIAALSVAASALSAGLGQFGVNAIASTALSVALPIVSNYFYTYLSSKPLAPLAKPVGGSIDPIFLLQKMQSDFEKKKKDHEEVINNSLTIFKNDVGVKVNNTLEQTIAVYDSIKNQMIEICEENKAHEKNIRNSLNIFKNDVEDKVDNILEQNIIVSEGVTNKTTEIFNNGFANVTTAVNLGNLALVQQNAENTNAVLEEINAGGNKLFQKIEANKNAVLDEINAGGNGLFQKIDGVKGDVLGGINIAKEEVIEKIDTGKNEVIQQNADGNEAPIQQQIAEENAVKENINVNNAGVHKEKANEE